MDIKPKQWLLTTIVLLQVSLAILAWRDLAQRADEQVRGRKKFWRIFVTLNPGNSLAYWLFGRR
jgi:hypothetical protein